MSTVEQAVSLAAFAPPVKLAHDDELPFGARVRFTHLAAVIRWTHKSHTSGGWWRCVEPKIEWTPPVVPTTKEEESEFAFSLIGPPTDWWNRKHDGNRFGGSLNKSIAVWQDEGEALLIGLVRRGVGHSWSASGSTNLYGEGDWEPGGFSAECFVPLYALKSHLNGVDYMLAPHWAVSVIE